MRRVILVSIIVAGGVAQAQRAEDPGPTILSRGLGTVLQGGGELTRLRPYLSLTGVYQTGLTPVSADATGHIPNQDDYGGELGLGLVGYRTWRHSVLGIDYRGNVRHYRQNQYYDGSDHSLILGLTHRPTRRLAVTLREAAGTASRDYGLASGYVFFDPVYADVPANELFNGRVYFLSTMGDLTFYKSPRLSFNMGGSGQVVRRRSRALIGVTGWSSRGDLAYRLSRDITLGADYNFTHYDFTNAFGATDLHTAAIDLSFRLGRRWDLGLRGGGSRVETLGLQRVDVDPIIAAIIGRTTGIEAVYRLNYLPAAEAKLSRAFQRSTLAFQYSRGVSPGNGVYLTSQTQVGTVQYSHTASRRLNFGLGAGYSTYSSLSQRIGKYENYSGNAGFTVMLKNWLHLVGRYDARRYTVAQAAEFRRVQHFASLGIAFSPGETPLSLW